MGMMYVILHKCLHDVCLFAKIVPRLRMPFSLDLRNYKLEALRLNRHTVCLNPFNTTLHPDFNKSKMDFKYLLLIFILEARSLLASVEHDRAKVLTKLAKELIENEKVSSTLWIEDCWTKNDELNFIKTLSIPIQFARSTAPSFDLPIDENINKQWFFVDMDCGEKSVNLLTSIDEKYFAHPFRWIIVDAMHQSIQNLTFLPDSNIILANRDEKIQKYNLKQVYQIGRNEPFIYDDFGHWSYEDGLVDLRTSRVLARRRRNLQGHQFRAATVFLEAGSENRTDLDDYQLVCIEF